MVTTFVFEMFQKVGIYLHIRNDPMRHFYIFKMNIFYGQYFLKLFLIVELLKFFVFLTCTRIINAMNCLVFL